MSPRIAFVVPTLQGGGAERAVLNLAASTTDCVCRVVVERESGELLDDPLAERAVFCAARGTPGFRAQRALRLARTLRAVRPDLVVSTLSPVVTAFAARGLGLPVMHWMQNSPDAVVPAVGPARVPPRLVRTGLRQVLRAAACLAAPSPTLAEAWMELGPGPARTALLPNPIVLPAIARRLNGSAGRGHLVSVGRLAPQKRHDLLIQAVAILSRERDIDLAIFGTGDDARELRDLASNLGVNQLVSFRGFVGEVWEWIRAADVFVLSSDFEGFGNVLVEALAVGTPIVATDVPHGARFILAEGRFGRLVNPGSAPALAGAIAATLDQGSPTAVEIEHARRRAEAFSAARVAERFSAIVHAVLDDTLTEESFASWPAEIGTPVKPEREWR